MVAFLFCSMCEQFSQVFELCQFVMQHSETASLLSATLEVGAPCVASKADYRTPIANATYRRHGSQNCLVCSCAM